MAKTIVRHFTLREEKMDKKRSDAIKKFFAKEGKEISTHEIYMRALEVYHYQLGLK